MHTLLITTSFLSTARVEERLRHWGRTPIRLEIDRFPTQMQLSLHDGRIWLRDEAGPRVLPELEAVWYRRLALRPELPEGTDPVVVQGVIDELRSFLLGLIASRSCFVLQHKHLLRRAERKPWQLSQAAACGLDVPATLCTSSADELRAWARALGRPIITKALTSFAIEQEGEQKVMHTSALENLDDLDGLELCPAAFQERLEKEREYRVTVVGDRLFTMSVASADSALGAVDWRRDSNALLSRWRPDTLPEPAAQGLLRLMERLELNFGAADFVRTPEGRCVFLEINPAGEYLWADDILGGAISDAIGDLLAGQLPRR